MAGENKVLLGVADSFLDIKEDVDAGWATNKFGGIPNWMPECCPSQQPTCGACTSLLYLIAQIYCPLEGDVQHRTLYIFGCINKDCRDKQGSWVALRCQFIEKKETNGVKTHEDKDDFMQDVWCADAHDWGIDDENEIQIVDSKFGNMAMKEDHDEVEVKNAIVEEETDVVRNDLYLKLCRNSPPCFRPMYVHVLEEGDSSSCETFDYELRLLREYEAREGVIREEATTKPVSEKYEKTSISDGDRAFHKFQKRIRFCKQQCLRYSWNGQPLLLSEKVKPYLPIDHIPPCSNCGSARVFEIQLMPALVSHLSRANEEGVLQGACLFAEDANIDFGTIFIYTCRQSCDKTNDGNFVPVDEFVVMQPCPDSEAFQDFVK